MKVVQVFLLCGVWFYFSAQSQSLQEIEVFEKWKLEFKKHYKTKTQEKESLRNFVDNLKFIDSHNRNFKKGLVSHELGFW